jgi:1,2-diacylglycerol 3-beta-galactosyltransferase
MDYLMNDKPHMTFLFSDTGGGHRAASEAIIESLHNEFGEAVVTQMVDVPRRAL